MSMHPPPDPDELASDLVDGLVTDDAAAARLRSDPDLAARVRAIESARAALRVPPAVTPGAVDRAMAATFAALDRGDLPAGGSAGSGGGPPPPVTHLRSVPPPPPGPTSGQSWSSGPAHAAGPPMRRRSGGPQWLAAAAAIVLIGLVTIGILSTSSSDSDDASSSGGDVAASPTPDPDPDPDTGTGTDAQAEAGGSGAGGNQETMSDDGDSAVPPADEEANGTDETATEGGTSATTSPATTDLGAVGNADELADRVRALGTPLGALDTGGELEPNDPDSAGPGAVAGEGTSDRSCDGLTDVGDRTRGETLYVADAELAGNPVRVHVYDPGAGQLRLVATDRSCTDVVDVPFSR